ncbi:MAG: AraC family transcriptional regulator [Breznakibacter sp.]
MQYTTKPPMPALRPYIKQYWLMTLKASETREPQRIVPIGCPDLTFHLGQPVFGGANGRDAHPRVFLCGQRNGYSDVWAYGDIEMLSVTFTPFGASQFFRFPMFEVQNSHLDLWGTHLLPVEELHEKLGSARSFDHQADILDTLFLSWLYKHTIPQLPRIAHVVRTIGMSPHMPGIDQLAREACLSRKQFERLFSASIGLAPHQFVRVVRFQRALFLQQTQRFGHLTELAYAAGFYDQSHLISEFKTFSGLTPSQYFGMCEPVSDFFG